MKSRENYVQLAVLCGVLILLSIVGIVSYETSGLLRKDPDGILLEFACWRRAMGQPGDVRHEPKTAAERTGVRV